MNFQALVLVAAAQTYAGDPQLLQASQWVEPGELRRDLATLADDSLGGRGAGYVGEQRAARYAARSFEASGLEPMGDLRNGRRTFLQDFVLYPQSPPVAGLVLMSQNVLGVLPGADPALRREIVVVGAHHDGQGQSGEADPGRSPPYPGSSDTIWNSADDNASGMVAVLAIARALHRSGLKTRRSILFATFGAEEHGLVGSLHYVGHPAFPRQDHVAMLTFEQLGRDPGSDPIVMGTGTSAGWDETISWANRLTGLQVKVLTPELIQDTDHYGFGVLGIPAIAMGIEVSADAHRPSDAWDKIDFDSLAKRTRYAFAMVVRIANAPQRPAFAGVPPCDSSSLAPNLAQRCSTAADPGLNVATLTDAERAAADPPSSAGGLKVVAVVAGLPAERAGLRPGDLILAINGQRLAASVSRRAVHDAMASTTRERSVQLRVKRGSAYHSIHIEPRRQ